jgi:6-phosphogluconolactonase
MVQFSPDKKYLLATDLGTDLIHIYKYNPDSKSDVLEFLSFFKTKLKSGPRHLTFSPDGKFVYLVHEFSGSVSVFSFKNGNLKLTQETSLIQNKFKGETSAADIHISPDGRFLYATNRGSANDITCFKIRKNGKLKWKSNTSTLGKGPRNFVIDPLGNFLLVAHQYTNKVVVFKIDKETGGLTNTGKKLELCSPVCLIFAQ